MTLRSRSVRAVRLRARSVASGLTRLLLWVIVAYGALLRFEALDSAYGPLAGSERFVRAQHAVASMASRLHPASLEWPRAAMPYRTDPKSYLDAARAMEHFYEARLREPLFVFSTKVGLWLTGGQDIAVSLVSSTFSALLVVATYALGRAIGGVGVGVASALLVAIEPQMIDSGIRGYRDDLFALLTVLFAWACIRLYRRPSTRAVLLVALTGAGACLTRITAFTFVVPSLLALVVLRGRRGWREVARPAAVAAILALALVAPFLVNCWRTFGDPLYSINWHSAYYSQRGQVDTGGTLDAGQFLRERFRTAPIETTDSMLRGLTYYPWTNKWTALSRHWSPVLAEGLKYLCLVGLLMWLWSAGGRVGLVVLATSLVPFAATWETLADWRFTQHAYPFYVVAAVFAVARPLQWVAALARGDQPMGIQLRRGAVAVLSAFAVVAGFFVLMALLPPLALYQELTHGRPASAGGDPRYVFFMEHEAFFFARGGWTAPRTEDNVTFRDAHEARGRLRVPMSGAFSYRCLVRLDAPPNEDGTRREIELTVNGWSSRMSLDADPGEWPRYWATIPKGVVRTGVNRVELVVAGQPRPATGPTLKFWYIRFIPQP